MNAITRRSVLVSSGAGYYETSGIEYSDSKTVYHSFKGKAVEPVGETLDQWTIFARLCRKIQELAPKMGFAKYRDELFGVDHDLVEVFNDVGDFRVRVLVTPSMQPGQVHVYHAWEKFQYRGGKSHSAVCASQLNPLLMVRNYGHIRYTPGGYQPNNNDKGTTVEARKT